MANLPTHHWIRVSDQDLAYLLNGPEVTDGGLVLAYEEWIDEVIDIVEDGLETA